ncbi:MAG: TetR/AcrR family transcriptional regulator [Edaphobacter sp.]
MIDTIQAPVEATDPRILRSRQMLMDSLDRLLRKKGFEDISVQEIADEATLNRATFYHHYPDKHSLWRAMTDIRFRDLLERRGITITSCEGALHAIALGVCDYLAETTSCPSGLTQVPVEGPIIAVIESMFKEGLGHHALKPGLDTSLVATTAAWAVFGAARRWFEAPNGVPAEKMADKIETMVTPIFLSGQP